MGEWSWASMLAGLLLSFLQLARFPNLLIPVAEVWERNQMRLFKAGQDWWRAIAFLSIAKSVRMSVSEQPRDLYEAAMWGHFTLE